MTVANLMQLIDLDALAVFKLGADGRYALKSDVSDLEDRIEEVEEASGEDNVIVAVKVNGTALVPDAQRAVDVTVPTRVSDLTIDGDVVTDPDYTHTDNNYTDADSAKLAGVTAGAEPNVIEAITIGGTAAPVSSKTVALGSAASASVESTLTNGQNLPTGSAVAGYVSGLGYQTSQQVSDAIASAIGSAQHLTQQVVQVLPSASNAQPNVMYLVPDDMGGSNYDMYILSGGALVLVGNTEADLSGYVQSSQIGTATTAQVQALFA